MNCRSKPTFVLLKLLTLLMLFCSILVGDQIGAVQRRDGHHYPAAAVGRG